MGILEEYDKRFQRALESVNNKSIRRFRTILKSARKRKKPIVILGNGGSITTASHFVQDLNKATVKKNTNLSEVRFNATALTDISTFSAYSNDLLVEEAFAEQIKNCFQRGGLEIVISASGNSPNILRAIRVAKKLKGVYTFGLLGFDGGQAKDFLDEYILVNTKNRDYGIVEDIHLQICHKVVEYIKADRK